MFLGEVPMSQNVWRTLFTENFDCNQYLYHYTTVDKAIKIIFSNQLWFSKITKTNDTTESKVRIRYVKNNTHEPIKSDKRTEVVSEYLSKNTDTIRILCFSRDIPITPKDMKKAMVLHKNHDKDKYFDVSGRGFALPRMWAQYASNHEGVCFIIDKQSFKEKLTSLVYLKESPVKYRSFFASYEIDESQLEQLYMRITQYSNGYLSFFNLLDKDSHFIEYNYFMKQKDWENEHEYRFVTLVDNSSYGKEDLKEVQIDGLFDFVKGIVIGEKIDSAYENVIRKTVDGRCEIKRIRYMPNICSIE